MKIGPYDIAQGALIPYERDTRTDQIADIDGDGGVAVTEVPFDHEFFRVLTRVPVELAEHIRGFLTNGVRYKAVPFTFRDDYGTSHSVRFWDRNVRRRYISSTVVELDLLFRREV